jgi:ATP-binding cassette subfamily B protein
LEFRTISKNLDKINSIYKTQSNFYHFLDFFRGLSLNIVILIVNIIVFYNAFKGSLSLGEMVLILQLVAQARIPLFAMSFILTRLQTTESGSKEFLEIINLKSAENYLSQFDDAKIQSAKIEFKNVNFNYKDNKQNVLKNVSFVINPSEQVALVGHSGAGKTTLINMILEFYNPTTGNIFLNDQNYAELNHNFIRNNVSLVFQDSELFSSTVKENILYGKVNASEKEIENALKMANAYEFVKKLPNGIDSEIGERGVKLSGGQKQRIQIARALLKNSPILILDEATSSLDAKSEKEVQSALENLMKNRLVIIIAHRFSTIQNVDKIIVLDEGKIVDLGTPKQLANKKGVYSELLNYQIQGNQKLLEEFGLS